MYRAFALLVVIFLTACVSPQAVESQAVETNSVCGSHKEVVHALQVAAKEQQQAAGVTSKGNLIEIWVGPRNTWSLTITFPSGKTCVLDVGNDWYSRVIEFGQKS